MTFTRIGQWGHVSDCGRYTVSMALVRGAYTFEAVRTQPGPRRLGTRGSLELAQALCEDDARQTPRQGALV